MLIFGYHKNLFFLSKIIINIKKLKLISKINFLLSSIYVEFNIITE